MEGEERSCLGKIDKLNNKAIRQQERVEEMVEWTDAKHYKLKYGLVRHSFERHLLAKVYSGILQDYK